MIPKTFKLGGRTWTVKRNVRAKKWYGKTYPGPCVIKLSTANTSPEEELHTFLHELMHAIAFTMGWKEFNKAEEKIDAVASLLLQAMTTADESEDSAT